MTSGKNPGKIGVFTFFQKEVGTYNFRVYQMMNNKEEDIWDILSKKGIRVFVCNPPNVLYAYKINGYMVAGVICMSDDRLTYPKELKDEMGRLGYKRDLGDMEILWSLNDVEFSRVHQEITNSQCRFLLDFLDKDWDFGFFVLTDLDRVQHNFWNDMDMVLSHYQNIDRNLGEVISRVGNDTAVIVVSDHGFGPNERTFLVNEWLINRGLLEVKKVFSVDLTKRVLLRIQKQPAVVRSLRFVWKKVAPLRLWYLKASKSTSRTPIQWDKTSAYSFATFGTIYLNVVGREPQGVVRQEDYEKVRTEIIEGLRAIKVKAYRREELYHGEYLSSGPDIILEIDDYVNSISGITGYGKEFKERFGGHHHRFNSTFIAWGPGIRKGVETQPRMYDIVPTILHMYGLPISRDLDGRVLREIFEGEIGRREIRYQEEDEKERIRGRVRELKALGRI